MSLIWSKLFEITKDQQYFEAVKKINRYLMKRQLVWTDKKELYGGLTGSDPIHGAYGKFEILNWGVKFFIDALILEMSISKTGPPYKD
jgi:hypothetical protein